MTRKVTYTVLVKHCLHRPKRHRVKIVSLYLISFLLKNFALLIFKLQVYCKIKQNMHYLGTLIYQEMKPSTFRRR